MTTYLTDAIALVRTDLRDPLAVRFSADDLSRALDRAVLAYSRYHPCQQKSTVAIASGSSHIDITSLIGRVKVDKVEFPVDQSPPVFQPFTLYLDSISMLYTKGDGTNCYVYWSGVHTLTDSTCTIPDSRLDIIILGATAYAIQSYVDSVLAEKAVAALESAKAAADKVSSRVVLAETALTGAASVSADIAQQITSTGAALSAASFALATAIATGTGTIDEAVATKLTDAAARIASAGTALTSAETALTSAAIRFAAAVTDMATGDDYINTANVGGDVAGMWAQYAQRDTAAGEGYNHQAAGYIAQAGQHISEATAELAHIKGLDDKRRALLDAGTKYCSVASEYTGVAAELNHKRNAYIQTAVAHLSSADAFSNEASKHRALSAGYAEEAKALGAVAADRLRQFMAALGPGSIFLTMKTFNLLAEQ